MPGIEMAPTNTAAPLVMSGDQMAVRIGGGDSKFMFIGQMGSGTSWQPISTPTYMVDKIKGDWLLMFHYNLFAGVDHQEEIDAVVKQYGARYEIEQSDSAAGYHINHSTDLYLLNQKGELAKTFSYSAGIPEIVDGLNHVIR